MAQRFSTAALREQSRRELIRVLDSVRGRKSIVIDATVSGPLSLVAEFAVLKIDFTIYFVPRRTFVCDRILEEEGVFGDITLGEYHLDIVPLEEDLLSLELDAFRPLFLDRDTTVIHSVAHALLKLQVLYGFAPRVLGIGGMSKILSDLMIKMRRDYSIGDQAGSSFTSREPDFDSILIIDRSVDLISPLRTQLTYEGLIDELFGIKSTFVEVPAASVSLNSSQAASTTQSRSKKLVLNNLDRVFEDVRNLGFEVVGSMLQHVALRIQEEED
eukprot:jgi/Hompol1/3225/HPOL_006412-RA